MRYLFYLNTSKVDAKEESPVMLRLTMHGQRITLYTKLTTPSKRWDTKRGRFKSSTPNAYQLNKLLGMLEDKGREIEARTILSGNPITLRALRDGLKAHLAEYYCPDTSMKMKEAMQSYIDNLKNTGKSKSIIQKYTTIFRFMREYAEKRKQPLSFETMDTAFMDGFRAYLMDGYEGNPEGLSNSVNAKYLKYVNTFLNACVKRGVTRPLEYVLELPKTIQTEPIPLIMEELEKLAAMDLSGRPDEEQVRDIFLFCCFTGQRHSDAIGLRMGDIQGRKWNLREKKTRSTNRHDLSEQAFLVLRKYMLEGMTPEDTVFPQAKNPNQKANKLLKKIAKEAGLDRRVKVEQARKDRIETTYPYLHEVITTHTARRTYSSIMIETGNPAEVVQAGTGHKDTRSFQKYVAIRPEEVARAASKAFEGVTSLLGSMAPKGKETVN